MTICAYQRQCIFGEIIDEQMRLNQYGEIVADEWQKSSIIRREIELDEWVVMPNHFHGIAIIKNTIRECDRVGANDYHVGANGRSPLRNNAPVQMKSKSLSSLMAGFKSITAKKINTAVFSLMKDSSNSEQTSFANGRH